MKEKEKVIKRFRDKKTKGVYESGTTYEGSPERIKELQGLGYLGKEKKEPSLLDGNVSEVTEIITADLGNEKLNEFLTLEKENGNRKGVIKHIEGLLTE